MSGTATLTSAQSASALLPRPPGGNGPGALLALAVHALLLAALTVSVDWRAETPAVVAAELWAQVPQAAAPRAEAPVPPAPAPEPPQPPTPAPTPPPKPAPAPEPRPEPAEPDIALERRKAEEARKKAQAEVAAARAERDRAAAAAKAEADRKKAQAEADRRKAQAEADRKKEEQARAEEQKLAQQRARNLERIMGQAAGAATGTGGSGTAAADAAPSSAYMGRLAAMIRRSLVFTGSVPDNVAAEVEVRAAPGGTILSRRLVKSSGHPEWDEAVLRAIDKTPRLPPDTDGRVPTWLTLVFRPKE